MLIVFLDTETSGLDPTKHRTLEIAFKVVDAGSKRLLIGFESIVNQPADVWAEADPASLKINGFTWEQTLQGKSEKAVASTIIESLNQSGVGQNPSVFLCQNPSFDRIFFTQLVHHSLQEHYKWPYHWLDLASMFWAVQWKKDPLRAAALKEQDLSKNQIAKYYNLPPEQSPHRAMQGVNHLIECYRALFNSSSTFNSGA